MRTTRGFLWVLCGSLAFPMSAAAQSPRGTVSDSASGQPVAGAVVSLIDSTGSTIARFITNARGEYRFPGFTLGRRMQVVRMGYRPRDIRLPMPVGDAPIAVRMLAIPMMLDQVSAQASSICPRRSDRAAAFALLEQARAGLLNAVVARQTHPARMTLLTYTRFMNGTSDSIVRQLVGTKSGESVIKSFYAVRSAAEFVRDGFSLDSGETRLYYGPDVDVLLDQEFTAGYCFHLRPANRRRPGQVGLAFQPARRKRERIDLDGTLWIDTLARKLVSLEYRYLGMHVDTDPVEPGGESTFWELSNGVVFIDKWHLRVPQPEYDTSYSHQDVRQVRTWYSRREPGGEVAEATWPDGLSYVGRLGTLNARVVDSLGQPLTNVAIRLAGTDYLASPDSLGLLEIKHLLPGPYTAVALHPELADNAIVLPTSLRFVAHRDSVLQTTIVVPDPFKHVRRPCSHSPSAHIADPLLGPREGGAMRIYVRTSDKEPVAGALWRVSRTIGEPWQKIVETGRTDADGVIRYCLRLPAGAPVELSAWRDGEEPKILRHTVGRGGFYTITLPFETPQ
jgi:hypothetical protein